VRNGAFNIGFIKIHKCWKWFVVCYWQCVADRCLSV